MDVTGYGMYTDYATNVDKVSSDKLQNQLENAAKIADDKALFDACKQFEAYLWEQVYKEMEKTVKLFGDDKDKEGYASNMVDLFKDQFFQSISEQTANEGSNSLAQMLYEQAKRNYSL
ncbi:MAG: rod-binding protein [Lachnospiraceae bacterium]|nr:rod-binding protein [Lachnospiraceae bacterium]